ncbi:uncharacterized protein LOC135689238 [Rhopilema esculentum]|uniref:uncharacterized protein LOC135689238 n=1 Tax=Rhopilema esculentum TaxID=499914 RepID=UPI0031D78689
MMDHVCISTAFESLPDAIILQILSYLQQSELLTIQLVSKRLRFLSMDPCLWRYCDFSNRSNAFLTGAAKSVILRQLRVIKITSTHVPFELLKSALRSENLKAISLKESRVRNSSEESDPPSQREPDINEMRCAVKFLDLQGTYGNINLLEEYIFYEGQGLEAFGLPQMTSSLTQKKLASGMPLLRVLDCKECAWFDDRLMLHISKSCIHLEFLSAMRCLNFTGKYLQYLLSGCKKLRSLNLQRTRLTDITVRGLDWEETALEELDISHCYGLDEEGFMAILPNLKKIKYLRTALTDDVLNQMGAVSSSIEIFELRRRYPLNPSCVSALLCLCLNMQYLDISLTPVESKCFRNFLRNMPKLRQISFAGHETLGTSEILREIRRNCKDIENVSINYYHANRDESLKDALINMARHSPKLVTVALQGFFIQRLVHELQVIMEESIFCNKIRFLYSTTVELPCMKHGLENAFLKYTRS